MSGMTIRGQGQLRSVASLLKQRGAEGDGAAGADLMPVPTGFRPLDRVLGGGLRPGGLTVVGGAPGVGKTILALQWARNIARDGRHVVYVCYEHDETELVLRLLALEAAEHGDEGLADRIDRDLAATRSAGRSLHELLSSSDVGRQLLEVVDAYAPRLHLVRASGGHTSVHDIAEHVGSVGDERPALFVDYLQKVAVIPEPATEAEKVTRVAEALKDLALTERIPVVAIVAVEMGGLKTRRVRMHHFRGSSALVFEADVALVMNEKANAVSNVHLAYDPVRAATFHDWVVVTVEKNRGGPKLIDLEHRKDFERYRFDPDGSLVEDQLVDERFDDGSA